MKTKILATTMGVALALGGACSSDSDDVNLQEGAGAQGGATSSGGAGSDAGGTTGDAGASSQVGGSSSGGRQGLGGGDGGSENGGSGNASTGGGGDTGGAEATGGDATGGASTGGTGATSSGGTGGIVCDAPCILLCEGGSCDCYCAATGGAGGAPTGGAAGAATGGASTGGVATGGAGGAPNTCGGVVCGPNEECCGPPECGYCIGAGTDPACAGSCTSRACGDEGLECLEPMLGYPGEICVTWQQTAGPTVILGYECIRNPCGADPLDCTCGAEVCVDGSVPGPQCMSPDPDRLTLVCDDFQGICNSPDTPIATPDGDRPIASLREGDLVYSVHDQAVVAVPVLRATRTAVSHHRVVRLVADSGVVLEISPGHPTGDGRTLGELAPDDELGGARVVSAELVPYRYAHTYDILPASDTGTYFAGGLRIGTTLTPGKSPARKLR